MGQSLLFVAVNMWLVHIFGDVIIKIWLWIMSICSVFAIFLMWPYLGMMWEVVQTIATIPVLGVKWLIITFRG